MHDSRQHEANKNPTSETKPGFDLQAQLLTEFEWHLKAEGKSPAAIAHYVGASKQFLAFTRQQGMPDVTHITREHVERWMATLYETLAPASVKNRFVGLRIFFAWLVDDDEIERNPMAKIKMPTIPETSKDVVSQDEMAKVFAYLEKEKKLRDAPIIALLHDTGIRATELATCLAEQVDWDTGFIVLTKTKNRQMRTVRVSPPTMRYLHRYNRTKRNYREFLVEGHKGALTREGIYDVVRKAFWVTGVKKMIGPHDLRHTSTSHTVGKLSESEMMTLYGWTYSSMARHYTPGCHCFRSGCALECQSDGRAPAAQGPPLAPEPPDTAVRPQFHI